MLKKHTVVDLFCGAGGMSKGFESTGLFSTILGVDHDAASAGTFVANHCEASFIKGNICYIKGPDLIKAASRSSHDIDVIIGGTPCQGFSTIGNRAVNDPRNLLFCEFARLVKEVSPKVFVLENVSGMKTMKDMSDNIVYEMVNTAFRSIGYYVDSFLLNAAHYGVPQERKRLLFIGHKYEDISIKAPKKTHYLNGEADSNIENGHLDKALTIMDAISDLPKIRPGEESHRYGTPMNQYQRAMRRYGTAEQVDDLTLHLSGHYGKKLSLIMETIPPGSGKTIWQLLKEEPGRVPAGAIPTSGFKNTYGRLDPSKPSMTITRNFGCVSSSRCIHPYQNRPLTPREAARIQSFPDDFIFINEDIFKDEYITEKSTRQDISDFADYIPDLPTESEIRFLIRDKPFAGAFPSNKGEKMNNIHLLIGNAVPPLLAKAIAGAVDGILLQIREKEANCTLKRATPRGPELRQKEKSFKQLPLNWNNDE